MRRLSAPIALLVLGLASPARAEDTAPHGRTSSLSWIRLPGAESCVATQALARAVEDKLARPVFVSAAQADVSVEGRVEPKRPSGWRAVVTVRDASGALLGTRELQRADATCDAMTEPLALVLAVMIDPLAPPPPAPTERVVIQREEVRVPVLVTVAAPPPPPEAPSLRVETSAGVLAGVGLLPAPALGLGVSLLIEPRGFVPLVGFGSYWLGSTASADDGTSASFSLLLAGAGACPIGVRAGRLRAYGCALGHIGSLRGRPIAFALPQAASARVVVEGALEIRATVAIAGPVALRAGLQGAVPLMRDSFEYDRADGAHPVLFQPAPVAALAELGLGIVVP